jgi:drug/metabolite transporter (DMT)-like permease
MGRVEQVRRLEAADLMLLLTVTIWSLNFTVTKYVLSHGFKPLAYAALRFSAAGLLFIGITWARERSFRLRKGDILFVLGAAVVGIFLNQVGFVYGTKLTTATTVALIFGTLPILTALFAAVGGIERLHGRFWLAAGVSFTGVCLVAVGCQGRDRRPSLGLCARSPRRRDLGGVLGRDRAAHDPVHGFAHQRLHTHGRRRPARDRRRAAARLADYGSLPSLVWVAYVFAVLGPLSLTNLLWFNSIERVGPSRASLYANLQPFLGAIFALLILSESITALQVGGGLLIAAGIVLSRREQPAVLVQEGA